MSKLPLAEVKGIADTNASTLSGGLATVATTGEYDDLLSKPTLGTAAAAATGDFATAAQGTASDNHIANASGAHAASAISFADIAGDYTATDVEAALAEVRVVADAAAGGGIAINDTLTNTSDAWSSQKITDYTATAVSGLIDSAPGALDTLNELAAAIGDDANFATTMTTALALRVRVDAAQGFTAPQQLQGRQNIGVITSVVDFASNFNAAIA